MDIDRIIAKNLGVLNRLEPHLGCVRCGKDLVGGRCLQCQAVPGETPCSNRECHLLYAHSGPCVHGRPIGCDLRACCWADSVEACKFQHHPRHADKEGER